MNNLIESYQKEDFSFSPNCLVFNHCLLVYLNGDNYASLNRHNEYVDKVKYMIAVVWKQQRCRERVFNFIYENDGEDWFCNLRAFIDANTILRGMYGEIMMLCPDEHKFVTRQYLRSHLR